MIAVVSMAGRFPGAASPGELFDNVLALRDEPREPPPGRWALPPAAAFAPGEPLSDRVYSKRACFLDPFTADVSGMSIGPDRLSLLDPLFHLAFDIAGRAWRGASTATLDRSRVGVILGAIALPLSRQDGENRHATGLPARLVAEALGLGGVAMTLDAACATGLYAVKLACDELREGRADAMLAGGLSRPDALYTQMGFSQLRALSPSGRCSPFSTRADGLVVGEGGGCFVLKRLEDAERDGDDILGVLTGVGLSNDLEGGLLAPASEGQLRAMRAAYAEAGWRPDDVRLIECHATGTPVGDAVELRSLRALWSGSSGGAVIGSVKSNIGHLLTGAGAAALCKVLEALRRGLLPPTANHETPMPELAGSPFRVLSRPEAWDGPRRAAVSAFGFGGINAHLLVSGYPTPQPPPAVSWGRDAPRPPIRGEGEPQEHRLHGGDARPVLARPRPSRDVPSSPADRRYGSRPPLSANRGSGGVSPPAHCGRGLGGGVEPLRFRIPPREADAMLAQQSALLLAADEALRGVTLTGTVGAFIGANLDRETLAFSRRWQALAEGRTPDGPPLTADRTMGALASVAASRLARAFHLSGPCFTLDSADPEQDALRLAEDALRRGEIDMALAGAVDTEAGGAVVHVLRRAEAPPAMLGWPGSGSGDPGSGTSEEHGVQPNAVLRGRQSPTPATQADEAPSAGLAFVYPGSGNDFAGMGGDVARLLGRENEVFWGGENQTVQDRIFAQVAVGGLVTDLLRRMGVRPTAAIGYSLGESAALFALGAWRDRERMRQAMARSTLFTSDLCGTCDAARQKWAVEHADWATAIVERPPAEVRAALAKLDRVYLQFIHGPRECVVGGDRRQVETLGGRIVPTTTTMHCRVVDAVAHEYREMHRLPVTPPAGIRFYSSGLGRAYDLTPDAAADAILLQATRTVDFPAVIEAAYRDGVRTFIEIGPGSSCTRLIGKILEGRPHHALAALPPGPDGLAGVRRVAEALGVALPTSNDNPVATLAAAAMTRADAHAAYLRLHASLVGAFSRQLEAQGRLLGATSPPNPLSLRAGGETPPDPRCAERGDRQSEKSGGREVDDPLVGRRNSRDEHTSPPQKSMLLRSPLSEAERGLGGEVALTREQCLTFAVGRIADVLGPDYAAIDAFPTRVRLPDEPLMLVDRILSIEGEPLSLSHGRVVTEHDIHPGAWYLDGGRIPTCLAVESGQADLFLSGYLGIDLRTRGLAVYRLLDAAVTFHRGLPGPGEVIRYDIHIDSFFRQDETHLFRFRFVGTVNGEPLLTMSDGIAGFFTEKALAAGQGVIRTTLQKQPRPAKLPDGEPPLPPMVKESYTEAQIDALRAGDLVACFGEAFAGLPLRSPMRLPGGRMRLVHRVTELDPTGGRFGAGRIRAEADIHPDDWFLTCHFIDDQVMPGTLMFECCLHTLRIFLMRLGWVGEQDEVGCEPVPGVSSKLKCRGQVTAHTKVVTYEVEVKERGYGPEPYAIVDALMYADGKPVVDIGDMSIRLTGLTRDKVATLWSAHYLTPQPPPRSGEGEPQEHRLRGGVVYPSPVGRSDSRDEHTSPPLKAMILRSPLSASERGLGGEVVASAAQILAYAVGRPSEAFGPRYAEFDRRFLARLPGPPFLFVDRITRADTEPFTMKAGGMVTAEYDVPPDAWYFAESRAPVMPFCILLEAALQVCGWTSAYIGSALTSKTPLHYRNLGGKACQLRDVTPETGTLTTTVKVTRVAASGGMIIQDFDLRTSDARGPVYEGSTTFGFFSPEALAQQIGIRDAQPEAVAGERVAFPRVPPFPGDMLRMMDDVVRLPERGLVEGRKHVRPDEWFFKAHFLDDPVWPGSLGLEALVQLLQLVAVERFGQCRQFAVNHAPHRWTYRGQVLPANQDVSVQGVITGIDGATRTVTGDGFLSVDGRTIYRMNGFTVRAVP